MTSSLLMAAYIAFGATAVDDLIIVTILFTSSRATGRPRPTTIVLGQHAGFAIIVGTSLAAAAGMQSISDRWVGLLGLIPIALGTRGLWRLRLRNGETTAAQPPIASSVAGIAAITLANGSDNIGVFTPLFRNLPPTTALLTAAGFMASAGALCALGALLGSHRGTVAILRKVDHWLVPAVFIAIGVLIMASTGAFRVFTGSW